jgi:exodeoxyribonuclease III
VKVTTWNVNGIRAREAQVLEWVQKEQPDVLCLQEVKASPEDVPPALCALEGYWCRWHGYKGYSGVGLHLRKATFPSPPEFGHPPFDHETRIVTARVEDLLLASIYVPNGNKDFPAKMRFLEALDAFAAQAREAGTRLLLCGDLNVARTEKDVHPSLRKPEQIGQRPEERALIEQLLSRGLVDLLRSFAPEDDQLFTWWAPWRSMRERNMGWRLDYVLASGTLAERATGCTSLREFGTSDHAPVTATFTPPVVQLKEPPPQQPTAEPPRRGQLSLDLGAGHFAGSASSRASAESQNSTRLPPLATASSNAS